jgi:acyl carrier protein
MSTKNEIIAIINDICRPDRPDLSDGDKALLDSGLDSLDFATMMMAVEDRYGITISENDMERLRTLNAIVQHVEQARGQQ